MAINKKSSQTTKPEQLDLCRPRSYKNRKVIEISGIHWRVTNSY